MKKLIVLSMVVFVCMPFLSVASASEVANTVNDVVYDQRTAITNKSFKEKVKFSRSQSFRIEGTKVVCLPGKGKHSMELIPTLPENVDIYLVLESKRTTDAGRMEVLMGIGQCTMTVSEYRPGGTYVRIGKRGQEVTFNDMTMNNCKGDTFRITTLPGSRVYEIQDLSMVKK